jgi:hypothetical protein
MPCVSQCKGRPCKHINDLWCTPAPPPEATPPSRSESPPLDSLPDVAGRASRLVGRVMAENARLREENQQLRRNNRQLRRSLLLLKSHLPAGWSALATGQASVVGTMLSYMEDLQRQVREKGVEHVGGLEEDNYLTRPLYDLVSGWNLQQIVDLCHDLEEELQLPHRFVMQQNSVVDTTDTHPEPVVEPDPFWDEVEDPGLQGSKQSRTSRSAT